nr:unnamed protein product [Digitaria exilis]
MPTEQRRHMPPAHFLPAESESSPFTDELRLRPERQVGLFKQGCFSEHVVRLTPKNSGVGQLVEKIDINQADDEPFEMTKEIETRVIGNLLPDDDDLFSAVPGDVRYNTQGNNQDDIDDDIFCTGGGMELEADGNDKPSKVNDGVSHSHTMPNDQLKGECTFGQQSSRILFVRNIDRNIEDYELKFLFERYGDMHTLDASCKHLGFVIISYYDVRSAENAMRALQRKPLRHRKLDIQYFIPENYPLEKNINQGTLLLNLDPSVTNDDLHQIFAVYGEIKEINNTSDNNRLKSIEFFDLRAAEAARRYALNWSDIAGNKIKLEPSCLGGTKRYTSKMLLAAIDESHRGTYDFIYLPIDFKNKCNVGYAFINMINPENIVPFYKTFNGKRWEKFNSEKVASLAYARIQGKPALVAHFQNSSLMNEDKRCRPILFHSDGPNAGDQEPFPVGSNIRSRPGRSRMLSWEQNHQDALSDPTSVA